jgi:hypothetical protein
VKLLGAAPFTLFVWAATGTLVGCGGSGAYQAPSAQSRYSYDVRTSSIRLVLPPSARRAPERSWMAPDAKQNDLLYISSEMTWDVDVYTYPQGRRAGVITDDPPGFQIPSGLCSDPKGDVFVTNEGYDNILEYAHAGSSPIATLSDPNEAPVACSFDPTSGTLAVANVDSSFGGGSISLYTNASGTPEIFSDSAIGLVYFCGFDDKGNLFVDGFTTLPSQGGVFQFAELPKGSSSFTNITLNRRVNVPGAVQWDGTYVAVGDVKTGVIYRTNGAGGKVESTTRLVGTNYDFQPWIQGKTIVVPSNRSIETGFWHYPVGGKAHKTIKIGSPYGATVSVAGK